METRGCSGLPLLWRQPKLARQIWLAHRRTFLPDQSGSGFRGSAAITPRLAPTAVKPGNPPTLHRSGRAANVSVPLFIAWERFLECLRDRGGRIAGQLASMRTTVPYKRVDKVQRCCPFGRT